MRHGPFILLALVVPVGALAAGAAGCTTTSTLDGATTTGSGGTGGGGAASTGGAGPACHAGKAACMAPTDCPPTQNECVDATCVEGCCGTSFVPSMTPTASQTPGDCMEIVCDGKGGTTSVDDDADVADEMNPCVTDACMQGTPIRAAIAGPCAANGGTVCGDTSGNNAGQCVQCNTTADCAMGVCLASGSCSPATCADGKKDGTETDVDCGGGACPPCAAGKACVSGTDCASGACLPGETCM